MSYNVFGGTLNLALSNPWENDLIYLYHICQTFYYVVSEYSIECNVVSGNMVSQSHSPQVLSFSVWLLLRLQVMSSNV